MANAVVLFKVWLAVQSDWIPLVPAFCCNCFWVKGETAHMLTFKSATAFSASATVPILTGSHCKMKITAARRGRYAAATA
jgi:hypothetical protein